MPYFERKPIEGLRDAALANVPMPGLPSRGLMPPGAVNAGTRLANSAAPLTGVVDQAAAILASERPSVNPTSSARLDPGSLASTQGTRIGQLQEQVDVLIERLAALVAQPPAPAAALSGFVPVPEATADAGHLIVEPAPVLSPAGPVMPGATAQISISLVNEDEEPARIGFMSTSLIGEDGGQIAAERISFEPRELTLQPGDTGEVIVRMLVPAGTRCGVYSGLVRASKLDYLHAVVMVEVQEAY